MTDILVRRLDDAVKQRLEERAARHGRSLEAEIREILTEAASPEAGVANEPVPQKGFGTQMAEAFAGIGFTPEEAIEFERHLREARSMDFGRKPIDFS